MKKIDVKEPNLLQEIFDLAWYKLVPDDKPKTTKEELAQLLNISLRTLYRHLDCLYAEELIATEHGKIVIYESHYQKIKDAVLTFV